MRNIITVLIISMFIFAVPASYAKSQAEINKQTVAAFYELALNQKNFAAAAKYLGPKYTQHNPTAADGATGLQTFIRFLREHYPNSQSEIKRIFSEGDYVTLQVHSVRVPGTRGRVIFDLFKLEKGKIVEHWDAVQDIPEKSANANGVF